ncbi:DUF4437 domain-containing protein [Roseibium sp. MMSF_3544]|uniref:DUF4437 domain-containing protein n=1 Tax=unclassified Roseibium TaxID=2629323 RepID=UPI00273DFE0D|nr:DUF4437 domain-containing protein [Roseibium sp. MMSF_3544]
MRHHGGDSAAFEFGIFKMRFSILAAASSVVLALVSPLAASENLASSGVVEVVPSSAVAFQPLNPARGDAGPQAGVLWGDIREDVPTGTIIQFKPGFSSPPHIHNITYRAVVISGAVHNDDPTAEPMWMGPGSFWTQPAGATHITAARADAGLSTAFLEIQEGPYLVQPKERAFANGEFPVNVEAGNIVWIEAADVSWVDAPGAGAGADEPKMAFLWGEPAEASKNGTFLKLPSGFEGTITGGDAWLRAVVIRGNATHKAPGATEATPLDPGSYFGSDSSTVHEVTCTGTDACIFYMSAIGKYDISRS